MLQRPQTLYLLGVFVISLLLLTGPVTQFSTVEGEFILKHSGIYESSGDRMDLDTWPLSALLIAVAVLAFLNIFFYRNRIRQMRICIFLMMLHAGIIGMIFFYISVAKHNLEVTNTLQMWRIIIPPVAIILLYLSFRRIRRDELMVKAYDRIR